MIDVRVPADDLELAYARVGHRLISVAPAPRAAGPEVELVVAMREEELRAALEPQVSVLAVRPHRQPDTIAQTIAQELDMAWNRVDQLDEAIREALVLHRLGVNAGDPPETTLAAVVGRLRAVATTGAVVRLRRR